MQRSTLQLPEALTTVPEGFRTAIVGVANTARKLASSVASRANDARVQVNGRYAVQVVGARNRAIDMVNKIDARRRHLDAILESAIGPVLDPALERLPEAIQNIVTDYRAAVRSAQARTHDLVVQSIEATTAVPSDTPATSPEPTVSAVPTVSAAPRTKRPAKAAGRGARPAPSRAARPAIRRNRQA